MKKFFLFMALCLTTIFAAQAGDKEVYYVVKDSMLTYYCNANRASWGDLAHLYRPQNKANFNAVYREVKWARFDASMRDTLLQSTSYLFGADIKDGKPLKNLKTIYNIENLITDEVTDMSSMFEGCQDLRTIDLSHFNTAKVTNMSSMFYDCKSLVSPDLSHMNTANVTDMSDMFGYCKAIENTIDLSHFNTEKVTTMVGMFANTKLSVLDLTGFKLSSIVSVASMFNNCNSLETIYCNDDWGSYPSIVSTSLFEGCTYLVGGQGTAYSTSNPRDVTFAHPDKPGNPGYFTEKEVEPESERYTVFDENTGTLTYYFDNLRTSRSGKVELYSTDVRFEGYNNLITRAVIDMSMRNDPSPVFYSLFRGNSAVCLSNLTEIVGMENLNTAGAEDFGCMFYGCSSLTEIDLSSFQTASVNDLRYMFAECRSLTQLDLRGFDISSASNMYGMFKNCTSLTTIYCNEDWSKSSVLTETANMFNGCLALVGGKGTGYDAEYLDKTYARPDKAGRPGYFTEEVMDPIVESDGWVHYDNGVIESNVGTGGSRLFYWGIMIPAGTVSDTYLTKVSLFVNSKYQGDVSLFIYQGGSTPAEGQLLHTQELTMTAADAFQEFALEPAVQVDPSQDLWIICGNIGIDYPASYSGVENAGNARWVGMPNSEGDVVWSDIKDMDAEAFGNVAWMIRGLFASAQEGFESVQSSDIRGQKMLQNGHLFIERNGKLYNAQGAEVK